MKRLDDYTNDELLELTEEQVQTLIDLECAYAGVRLLPELPVKPVLEDPEPDMTIYSVDGASFYKKEDAQAVADLMASFQRCVYRSWNNDGIQPDNSDISIGIQRVFSSELAQNTADLKAENKRKREEYEKIKKDYDSVMKDRQDIVDGLHDRRNEARAERDRIERYKREFKKYLELANNDSEIAFNFLLNARNEDAEFIKKLKLEISIERMESAA